METTIAEIVCIVLILGGLALYFWLRIGLAFNAPGFAGRTVRNLGFRPLRITRVAYQVKYRLQTDEVVCDEKLDS